MFECWSSKFIVNLHHYLFLLLLEIIQIFLSIIYFELLEIIRKSFRGPESFPETFLILGVQI